MSPKPGSAARRLVAALWRHALGDLFELQPEHARREEICQIFGESYDPARWNDWRWQMRHRLIKPEHFEQLLRLTGAERRGLALSQEKFAVAVTPHIAELIDPTDPRDPIRLQVVPREEELMVGDGDMEDPCGEDHDSVVPGLVHRYPDRVLLLALDTCAAYCRYCTRSRLVSQGELDPLPRRIDAILDYLAQHTEVQDVLVSGGEPLLMSDERLDDLLGVLRRIEHIECLRIESRVPGFLPQRITPELVAVLRKHRVWLSLHFCHARELTPEVAHACDLLADGGIPLGAQMVLLKGVNDDIQSLTDLFRGLQAMRVRPGNLNLCDPVIGTAHLRTPVADGIELVSKLRNLVSSDQVPTLVVHSPCADQAGPMQANAVISHAGDICALRAGDGRIYEHVYAPGARDGSSRSLAQSGTDHATNQIAEDGPEGAGTGTGVTTPTAEAGRSPGANEMLSHVAALVIDLVARTEANVLSMESSVEKMRRQMARLADE